MLLGSNDNAAFDYLSLNCNGIKKACKGILLRIAASFFYFCARRNNKAILKGFLMISVFPFISKVIPRNL